MSENDATHEGTTGAGGGAVDAQAITVEIYDQTYRLRGSDHGYVEQLAALVDGKM